MTAGDRKGRGPSSPTRPNTQSSQRAASADATEGRPDQQEIGVASYDPFPTDDDDPFAPDATTPRIVARYDYTDEHGDVLFQVRRWEPGKNGKPKSFSQHKRDGKRFRDKLYDARRVLFRLPTIRPAVLTRQEIYLPEGEKDVLSLVKLGLVATCNPMGAGNWEAEFAQHLRHALATVIRDNDATGLAHAATINRSLTGVAERVRVVRPMDGCKDVTEHLAAGYTLDDLVPVTLTELDAAPARKSPRTLRQSDGHDTPAVVWRVLDACSRLGPVLPPSSAGGDWTVCCPVHDDSTPSMTVNVGTDRPLLFHCFAQCPPDEIVDALIAAGVPRADLMDTNRPVPVAGVKRMSTVEAKSVRWVWRDGSAYGKVTNFEGDGEHGKSMVTGDLVAKATTGGRFPDGQTVEPAAALFITAEDDYEDTVVPRLMAANADLDMCFFIEPSRDAEGSIVPFSLPDDMPTLTQAVRDVQAQSGRQNVIVVIDPVSAYLSERINSNNDASVRRALSPLAELAKQTGAAFWIVRHFNKNSSESNVGYRGGGSIGFFAAARNVFVFGKDANNPTQFVMAQSKNNIGRGRKPSFTYHIEEQILDGGISTGRVVWDGTTDVGADQLFVKHDSREHAPQRESAERALAELFTGGVTSLPVTEVKKQLAPLNISDATIKRAADSIGIKPKSVRKKNGQHDHWEWVFPIAGDGRVRVQMRRGSTTDGGGAS